MIELWAQKVSVLKGYWGVYIDFKFYSPIKGKVKKARVHVYDDGHAFLEKEKKFSKEAQKELEGRAKQIAASVIPRTVLEKWTGGGVDDGSKG